MTEVNKWDSPAKDDAFGREPFVDTILKTIQSSAEGFNLGISARWGEGKSSILEQLEPKLVALDYRVLVFRPWKYTQDQISIKRKFLIDIYSQLGQSYDEAEFYSEVEQEKNLDPEDYATLFASRLGVFLKYGAVASGLFLLALLLLKKWGGVDIDITQIFLTNLFIPVFVGIIPIIQKITEVTVKQTTPKIESAEQFEKKFNDAIEAIMGVENPPKKIIIFVDDLDRCSAEEVEQVLTALFTFFNNKYCTYLITADHTVIRRYISNFLHIDPVLDEEGSVNIKKTNDLKQKNATEYLKKIFQINFILPRIPNDLLEPWVKRLLDANPIVSYKNPYSKEYLINLILNNLEGNPRKIKHFIRTLAFQLEAIHEKVSRLSDRDGEECKNLTKVRNSPELLAKILIIQDRFPDFYETLVLEPRLLEKHEAGEANPDKDLQTLIAQEPKFSNSVTRKGDSKTIDPYYFLYFSGSTGYAEVKAVDPNEVKVLAKNADFDGLTKVINGLTDEPRNTQIEHIQAELTSPQVPLTSPEKVNVVRSLFHVFSLLEEPSLRLENIKDLLRQSAKYTPEFSAFQSIDFDKIIPFADFEAASILLTQVPLIEPGVQAQLFESFIGKQADIDDVSISNRFIEGIADGIKRDDSNSSGFIGYVPRLTPENFTGSELLQDVLLQTYVKSTSPLKHQIFVTLLHLKDQLSPSKHQEFEYIVHKVIETEPIGDAIGMLARIPTEINKSNFDLQGIANSASKRISELSRDELEQWVNVLTHPNLRKEFGPQHLDPILSSLADVLNDSDTNKVSYIQAKLPDFLGNVHDKSHLLQKIVQSIGNGPLPRSSQTLSILQGMSDFWSVHSELKKEFARELKVVGGKKQKEIRELMIKSSNELVPSTSIRRRNPFARRSSDSDHGTPAASS